MCLAGVQVSGSSRAEATKQAEPRAVHAQPAKGPGPRGKPIQQARAAKKSLVVPRSPKLGRPRDRAKQVPHFEHLLSGLFNQYLLLIAQHSHLLHDALDPQHLRAFLTWSSSEKLF